MQEGSLYSLMKKNKKFQEKEAAEKISQICEGIKEMHSHNIVHRDLKPENVVMSNVISSLFREFAKFVILVGLQYVKIVDKLIAELQIMFVLKLFKEMLMTVALIYGVQVFQLMSFYVEKHHFMILVVKKQLKRLKAYFFI